MTGAWDDLLGVLRPLWPLQWSGDADAMMALTQLEDDARRRRPSSLPVVQTSARRISWLSVAASPRELRDYSMTPGSGCRRWTLLPSVDS